MIPRRFDPMTPLPTPTREALSPMSRRSPMSKRLSLTLRARFAYADPPYVGQARRLYGSHPDFAGEVNHTELIERLQDDFDGWALSCSMKSLPTLMKMCPDDVLTLAWMKPNAVPMGDHRHYSWEPVIMQPVRNPRVYTRTHLALSTPGYTFRPAPPEHVIGEKPEGFAHWLFDNAGLQPDDQLTDLYPGSGAIGRAWSTWQSLIATELPLESPPDDDQLFGP